MLPPGCWVLSICAPTKGAQGPPVPHRPLRVATSSSRLSGLVLICSSCSPEDLAPARPLVETLTTAYLPRLVAIGEGPGTAQGGPQGTQTLRW